LADDKQRTILNYANPQYAKPQRRTRRYFNFSPADAELMGCFFGLLGACFAFVSIIVLFLATVTVSFKLMERLVISMAYGSDRYAAGLRIVTKNFLMSDGTMLPGLWRAVYIAGVFGGMILVMAPYVKLLQKLGLLQDEDVKESPKENT